MIHFTKGSQLCICYFCTKPLFLSFLPPYSFWWPLCYLLYFPLWPQSSLPIPPSHHSYWLRLPTNQSMVTVSQPNLIGICLCSPTHTLWYHKSVICINLDFFPTTLLSFAITPTKLQILNKIAKIDQILIIYFLFSRK